MISNRATSLAIIAREHPHEIFYHEIAWKELLNNIENQPTEQEFIEFAHDLILPSFVVYRTLYKR